MARHRKRHRVKGSSKAGRPRKDGDRFPSGKLRPPPPNAVTQAKRKAGDAEAGEHPLDFAFSQKWITEREHRAAMAYRSAYDGAHLCAPRMSRGSLCEVEPTEDLRMNWSQLSDDEITDIFDRVFNVTKSPESPEKAQASSMMLWKHLNIALTSEERAQLFQICVMGSWPFWITKMSAGHDLGRQDKERLAALLNGLSSVSIALRPPKPKPPAITPVPVARKTRCGRSEAAVRYETEYGDEVSPVGQRGQTFEVAILKRRS